MLHAGARHMWWRRTAGHADATLPRAAAGCCASQLVWADGSVRECDRMDVPARRIRRQHPDWAPECEHRTVQLGWGGAGERRVVAYYTGAEQDGPPGGGEPLRAHLTARVPEYMVPAVYVRLDEMPLTANGKLDRTALPAPEADAYATRGYAAPVGEIETTLAEIWADLLSLEHVGRHDNFIDLRVHTLLAVQFGAH